MKSTLTIGATPPARPFGGRGATERSQGHVDWQRNVRQTSIASTGCAARRTSTAKIEVAGSSKSTKSHRRIAILTATSKSLHPSQKVKIISPSRSLPMRTVQHCLKKDGNSAKRHRVSAPTQYKKERENKNNGIPLYFPPRYATGEAPSSPSTAPALNLLLVARCTTPYSECGCENSLCGSN